MRESVIEKYLIKQVEAVGGECAKWVSPGRSGVPDRICIFPTGQVVFVECKAPGEKLRPLQAYWARRLEGLGCHVYCVSEKDQIDKLIEMYVDICSRA